MIQFACLCKSRYIQTAALLLIVVLFTVGVKGQEITDFRKLSLPEWDSTYLDSTYIFSMIRESNLQSRRDTDSAIATLETLIAHCHVAGVYDGVVEGSYFLGYIYTQKGMYPLARQWFRHAVLYSSKGRRRPFKMCRILINIGNTYQFEGNYKEAVTYYFRAAELAEQSVKTDIAIASPLIRIYNHAGASLLQFGQHEKAMYYFDKAEAIAKAWKVPETLPAIWANKAIVYGRTRYREKAWEYSRKALYTAKQYEQAEVQVIVLQNMAELEKNNGELTRSIAYLEDALRVRNNLNPYYTNKALYTLGATHLSLGNYELAEQYLTSAYGQAIQYNIPEHQLYINQQLAILYSSIHKYREAFRHQQAAYQINDSLLNKEKTIAVDMLEIKYRTAEKDKTLAQNQLMITEQKSRLRQKNIWIYIVTGSSLLLALSLVSYLRANRHKQKIRVLKAVIEGEEKERSRIARELHDGIGGLVSAMNMNIILLGKEQKTLHDDTYQKLLHITDEISNEIRKTAHNLMPETIARNSLPEAVQLFCNHINKNGLEIDIQTYGPFELLEQDIRLSLYRIIQELVQNVIKHAQATYTLVQMSLQEPILCIIVEDNGVGIDPGKQTGGMGLHSIKTRIESMNGRFSIESDPGKGTTALIELPV